MEVSQDDSSSATLDESYHWTETDVQHRQYSGGVLLDWTDATGSGRASGDAYRTDADGYSREDATVSTWSTSGGGTVRDMNLLFGGASTFISGSWAEDHYDETFNWTRHDANSGSTAWTTSLSGSGNHVWGSSGSLEIDWAVSDQVTSPRRARPVRRRRAPGARPNRR